jgi:hypothetical protein
MLCPVASDTHPKGQMHLRATVQQQAASVVPSPSKKIMQNSIGQYPMLKLVFFY